ncbi:class I SAM-dependent DNA methyltransferase [Deinococcus frigens]|uniref:HsdM family class I SAM-dependent methyltransferase n=1 Tax=Deinococcus frigens TaxID=249403 RepID=UPI000A058CB3|nr:N-6 DNA methylase [Deinococcus frigens]
MTAKVKRRNKRSETRARYHIRLEAERRGWNVRHWDNGGDFLEENEILASLGDVGLGLDRPDFLIALNGDPIMVVEAKNNLSLINLAIKEAVEYADTINSDGKYKIKIAVGAAGDDDDGFAVEVRFFDGSAWAELKSHGYALTNIPSRKEVELAVSAGDATTSVSIPTTSEFISSAIEISELLRLAKVEAPLRPKVIGALTLALYNSDVNPSSENILEEINAHVDEAINLASRIEVSKKKRLIENLILTGSDYDRLEPFARRIILSLKKLNIRSVIQTDADFLGMFYEAFLRYGYDNNALGIVFTPRHITKFCIDLVRLNSTDKVIDIASGTGGFLVSSFDDMMQKAKSEATKDSIKKSIYGYDTNPTIWALASLNMFFRGDGKSNIEFGNSLDESSKDKIAGKFDKAFLNPPFSQEGEPERRFIDAALDALKPEGMAVVLVKAGIFCDEDHADWRKNLLKSHSLIGIISMPDDLFYPTAAPTSIVILQAHIPQSQTENIFISRIFNDGYVKLKGKRVETTGSQLEAVKHSFHDFIDKVVNPSDVAHTIAASLIAGGEDWSPQKWLPQPEIDDLTLNNFQREVYKSIYQAAVEFPELSEIALDDFGGEWSTLPPLPLNTRMPLDHFFTISNGSSSGEKNYIEGHLPYISSGDPNNSIVRLIEPIESEVFISGGITITAFGRASLQPWPFMARGNGGSAVRVLTPKFAMTKRDMAWFVAQINLQRWRFFYGRMAIKGRLKELYVDSPENSLNDNIDILGNLQKISKDVEKYSDIG